MDAWYCGLSQVPQNEYAKASPPIPQNVTLSRDTDVGKLKRSH